MKNSIYKRILAFTAASLLMAFSCIGCGSSPAPSVPASTTAEEEKNQKQPNRNLRRRKALLLPPKPQPIQQATFRQTMNIFHVNGKSPEEITGNYLILELGSQFLYHG